MLANNALVIGAVGVGVLLYVIVRCARLIDEGCGKGVAFFAYMTTAWCVLALILVALATVDTLMTVAEAAGALGR